MRLLLPLLLVPMLGIAQDKKPDAKKPERIAINDTAKLKDDKDFAVQGEYQSEGKEMVGIQVIAMGNGKFKHVQSSGGLPGEAGFTKVDKTDPEVTIARKDGTVQVMAKERIIGSIENGTATISDGGYSAIAKKVERKSPTLGAKPPAGAIMLFNAPEDIKNWDGMKVVELSDGKFLGVGGRTKQKFQSFTLHLEFRLPWMPNSTGQQRGNSGVYLQDRYELQVLDSFGLKGENNECGGFYQIAKPNVNMCFPPMTWQTYDIDFTAAQFADGKKTKNAIVTVKHNGVVIHDKLELPSNTKGGGIAKEVPEPGALFLQNHGDPVVYRNVWIKENK